MSCASGIRGIAKCGRQLGEELKPTRQAKRQGGERSLPRAERPTERLKARTGCDFLTDLRPRGTR